MIIIKLIKILYIVNILKSLNNIHQHMKTNRVINKVNIIIYLVWCKFNFEKKFDFISLSPSTSSKSFITSLAKVNVNENTIKGS